MNGVTPDNDGNITLSASSVGAVGYNTPQTLTDAQKQQARDNINATAPYEAGDNISITGRIITTKAFPCNPNLLYNWYFGNPVNQRGQTSYAGTYIYTIDRWKTENTVTVVDGGITVKQTGSHGLFYQYLEDSLVDAIAGKVVTYSALTTNGIVTATTTCPSVVNVAWDLDKAIQGNLVLDIYGPSTGLKQVRFFSTVVGTEATILAVKLELGSQQTLAHQENGVWVLNEIPDYGEQLRRCQRYAKVYGSIPPNLGQPFFCAGFYRADSGVVQLTMVCPEFRKTPVVSILDGNWDLFDGENTYDIGEINVVAYMPGVITLGITSPGNSFSSGKILALFANSGKLMLSADL